jgi:putative phosphoribosyl transferase
MRFDDRTHAGRLLADALRDHAAQDVVVLALPRGGVVVGIEVARALSAPLDLVIPRKVGHPDFPEYAIAAVAEVGEVVANEAETARMDRGWFEQAVAAERAEAARRRASYLGGRPAVDLTGKTAIIVDDGIATGLTMRAAVRDARHRDAARVVVAVPVAPVDAVAELRASVDEVVTLLAPEAYEGAVGAYYRKFGQVTDDEVMRCLAGDDMTWAAP